MRNICIWDSIIRNIEKIKKYFLQGTARRPEARPEGRGREEERKAPSYGNSFHTFIYYYLLMVIVFFILVYYYLLMVVFFIFIYYHLLRDAVKNVLADFVRKGGKRKGG